MIADLKNSSKIEANLTNFDLSSLMNSFYVLDIYKANGNMELSYDLSKNTGFANLNLLDGGFKKSPIINAISLVLGKDLTRDSFQTAKMNANINKENIDFNLDMKSNYSDINIKNANVNTNSGYLNIPFSANIDKIDFKGRIKGTMENPKVNIDARSVLKTIKNIFGKKEEEKPKEKIDKLLKKIF